MSTRILAFSPAARVPLMPDSSATHAVAHARAAQVDASFEVILRRGDQIRTIFLESDPTATVWSGFVGTAVYEPDVAALVRHLEDEIARALEEGWTMEADSRR